MWLLSVSPCPKAVTAGQCLILPHPKNHRRCSDFLWFTETACLAFKTHSTFQCGRAQGRICVVCQQKQVTRCAGHQQPVSVVQKCHPTAQLALAHLCRGTAGWPLYPQCRCQGVGRSWQRHPGSASPKKRTHTALGYSESTQLSLQLPKTFPKS